MSTNGFANESGDFARNAINEAISRGGYRFSLHGASTVRRFGRRTSESNSRRNRSGRTSRSTQLPPYVLNNVANFDLTNFAMPERLYSVFRILRAEGGPGAGTDGITYTDFSNSEIYAALRQVSGQLVNHVYTPQETRLVRIPKGDGRYRELQLNCILDRVIAKALQLALDAYWRTQLPRLGKDVFEHYATMNCMLRRSDARFLLVRDIRDCFPTAPIEAVLECHRRHFSQGDLLWLIETIVRGHDGLGHPTGLYQGSPYSPVAMELLLHTYLDTWFGTEFREFPFLFRYVDNLNILCRNGREGWESLRFCEKVLGDLGFNLKPENPPMDSPMDLRHEDPNRKVLGLNPSWRNEQLHFTIPDKSYNDLRNGLALSIVHSEPVETAFAVATGWLNALGPALTNAVIPAIVNRVISIFRECGFNEQLPNPLLETCQLAQRRWRMTTERRLRRDV